jgi:ribosomal protein L11 methyltransferase
MPEPSPTAVARLSTDAAAARRIGDALAEVFDGEQIATSAFEQPDGRWSLAVHFRERPDEGAVRALIEAAAGAGAAQALAFETLAPTDWVKTSLAGLVPVPAGRFTVHGAHDRARVRANRIGIEIEAALAFGTGHHGTTRGCLLALDYLAKQKSFQLSQQPFHLSLLRGARERKRGLRILDVGTGTGVLAIAAAKTLKTPVLASDIDPRSVIVARENAVLNAAAPWIEFIHAAGLQAQRFRLSGPFDLVMANILLGPLTQLAPRMAQLLAPGARVILSGLLDKQARPALAAYRAQGLVPEKRISLDGWTTLILRRR